MFRFLMLKKIKPVLYLSIFFLISVVWFGLPMADKINVNKDYNSIVNIDKHLKKYDTKIYEFKTFTPEIIWEYGKPIPVLTQENKIKATKSNKFLILTEAYLSDSLKEVFSNYKTTKIDSVDMNPVSTKHKRRLYRELYLLEKAENQ